jgi:hypothetical protein
VEQGVLPPLVDWQNFYIIIGSSGAALTGLQFVVMTLSAEINVRGGGSVVDAFSTPTIVHFCAVLFISAILSAPWSVLSRVGFALGVCGVAGLVYAVIVIIRMWRQTVYAPVLEDWTFHAVLPLLAYAALLVAAVVLERDLATILFVIGGSALLLLFIGIHNAWDAVVFIASLRGQRSEGRGEES